MATISKVYERMPPLCGVTGLAGYALSPVPGLSPSGAHPISQGANREA